MGRILVTGGAGFIGSHVVDILSRRGEEVVVLDSLDAQVHGPSPQPRSGGWSEFHHADVGDSNAVAAALRGVDRVVHLAAVVGVGQSMQEIERYVRRNSQATASFLEAVVASRPRPRLVVASSMSVYGEGEKACSCGSGTPVPRAPERMAEGRWEVECAGCGRDAAAYPSSEDDRLRPASVYAITKRDHEELCLTVGGAYGIPTTALRFFNVYGPGQSLANPYTGAAAIFASRLLNGRPPIIFEDGYQTRDLVHVSDVARAVALALDSDLSGVPLNVGTGTPTAVRQIARLLADALPSAPDAEPELSRRFRAGDVRHCYADTWMAERELGFRAEVRVADGLAELARAIADERPEDRVEEHLADLRRDGLA